MGRNRTAMDPRPYLRDAARVRTQCCRVWTKRRFALCCKRQVRTELAMHTPALCLRACLLVAALAAAGLPGRADAGWSDVLRDGMEAARATEQTLRHGMEAARATEQTLREKAEQAIVLGGVLVYRHRHAVAGAALGCVAGSVAATTTTLGAALASGGASLTTTVPAAALGCGLGALGGAAIGQRLDSVYEAP
jgi:hypothetical protein